jgi:putative ABC transport system permease protein
VRPDDHLYQHTHAYGLTLTQTLWSFESFSRLREANGGVVLGSILALGAGVQLSRMFQMPRLPLYYLVGGMLLLWIVGLLAVLAPALRAASISPAVGTRTV